MSTAGKVSVRNSFVTVSTPRDPLPTEEIHHTSSPIDNCDMTTINDSLDLLPLDNASMSAGQRRPQVCTLAILSTPLLRVFQGEPLLTWLQERDKYLAEFIMMEGRGDAFHQERCIACSTNPAEYRCHDCLGQDLFCQSCLVSNHARMPFHVVNVWFLSFGLSIAI
jgi:hypothetical protein